MRFTLTTLFLTAGVLVAQEATSDPIGFNKVTCLANSDTIVGVPLRKEGSMQTTLSGSPTGTGDSITLPVTATLTAGQFNATSLSPTFLPKYYVKFTGGTKSSYWYSVESNTTTSITVNLNGDTLTGVAAADPVLIAEYWTLNTLFPPAGATTSWTETPTGSGNWVSNGHAIVASTGTLSTARRTEVLMPNVAAPGINAPAEGKYYIHYSSSNSTWVWKRDGSGNTDFGNSVVIYPDTLFTIRHPGTTGLKDTTYRSLGEVHTSSFVIPLSTQDLIKQDNYIALPRPIPVTLEGLNLRQSGAFAASTGTLSAARRDELLVFDNALALRNKAPSARYYVHGGIWKLDGGGNTDRGTIEIPASAGFIVRKYQVSGHPTSYWTNTPSY